MYITTIIKILHGCSLNHLQAPSVIRIHKNNFRRTWKKEQQISNPKKEFYNIMLSKNNKYVSVIRDRNVLQITIICFPDCQDRVVNPAQHHTYSKQGVNPEDIDRR